MNLNSHSYSARIFIAFFLLFMCYFSYKAYDRIVFVRNQRKQVISNFYDADLENSTYEDILQKKYKDRRIQARKIIKMKAMIKQVNLNQKIYNAHLTNMFTHIIVIQVHSNVFLLRHLLASLKVAHSIDECLLIFSHDVFDVEINKVVHSINFTKYMQIFYPYSTQLHPNVFPGYCQGKHCEKSSTRDPVAAQKKHHWWWQVNQVFDHLNITKNYNRTILFLEEDNYVTPDFMLVSIWLENTLKYHCTVCEMISLGAHKPEVGLYSENVTISVEMWGEHQPGIGLGFAKPTWKAIQGWTRNFCTFNDYTWTNSLKYIGSKQVDTNFYFAAIDGPRVFRIGTCDEKDFSCKPEDKVEEVTKFLEQVKHAMFPWSVATQLKLTQGYYTVKPLGSFKDERDHELCIYFTKNNVWY